MSAPLSRRFDVLPRSPLVLRIYLMGLLQFAIVVTAMVVISRLSHRTPHHRLTTAYVADNIASSADPVSEVARAHAIMGDSIALVADDGETVAEVGTLNRAKASNAPSPGEPSMTRLRLHDGRNATLYMKSETGSPPGLTVLATLAVIVTGLFSWLVAHSLARPLAKLSETARAFGRGDLSARAALSRKDELGDVAHAFDEMAERVGEALRAEKELLANVSHELRTPLQRIQIALELAREGDADMTRTSLGDIAEDLGELSRIVDDVLTAARLSLRKGGTHDPARAPLRLETTDVRDTIGKAVSRFRAVHPARPLSVTVPRESVNVVADPVLLRRVVDNLLENAHKYSDDPTTPIELSAERADEGFAIVVADHGVGISEEDLERVFEPFFRADKSRTRATGGLGLGLALSKQIIDAHEGTLSIASRPDKGTTATVRLPLPA